jgi:hypothetical protein
VLIAAFALGSVHAANAESFAFHYQISNNGYVRDVAGVVTNPEDLAQAFSVLKPPPGAHGAYGLLGDDGLSGKAPGDGLRQLGSLARNNILFTNNFKVVQPPGFESAGVQSGTFTASDQLNDTTLGWVLFDIRPQLEVDLKPYTLPLEEQWRTIALKSGLSSPLTAHERICYKNLASCYATLADDDTPTRYFTTRIYIHVAERIVSGKLPAAEMPSPNKLYAIYDKHFATPDEQALVNDALDKSIKALEDSLSEPQPAK